MRKAYLLMLPLVLVLFLTGCIKTYTYQAERVDQDLSRGNRGYVEGDVYESETDRKSTRTMVGVDVMLPSSEEYKAKKERTGKVTARRVPVVIEETAEMERAGGAVAELELPKEREKFSDEQWVKREEVESGLAIERQYKVQKGDTLEKIAKKFLGKRSRWPEIYKANKDIIKNPANIYPGQVINIPADVAAEEEFGVIEYK